MRSAVWKKTFARTPSAATGWAPTVSAAIFSRAYFTAPAFRSRSGSAPSLIALVIGTIYGLIAGFKGGNWDHFMMRIVDIFYGLPDMLIFILLSLFSAGTSAVCWSPSVW